MNVLVIGGSGLLGTHTIWEALKRGHTVTGLSRGKAKTDGASTRSVKWIRGDVHDFSEAESRTWFAGQDAVVYALGLDERQVHRRPVKRAFHDDHVTACLKVLRAARQAGVRKFVVFGSYFTYFDGQRPEMRLAENHAYIRSRRDQRDAVLNETGPLFDTVVLEIPYVIGAIGGNVPPWAFLFDLLAVKGKTAFFFLKGGTAAVTARQIGEAAIGAIERGAGGTAYPVGGVNLTWRELARSFFQAYGREKKLTGIGPVAFTFFGFLNTVLLFLTGKERGLTLYRFAPFQYMEAFIDPEPSMKALGYGHDDYQAALCEMVKEWESLKKG